MYLTVLKRLTIYISPLPGENNRIIASLEETMILQWDHFTIMQDFFVIFL